jgi:hypothetical protein
MLGLDMTLQGGEACVTFKPDLVDDGGNIGDESTRKFLQGLLDKFASLETLTTGRAVGRLRDRHEAAKTITRAPTKFVSERSSPHLRKQAGCLGTAPLATRLMRPKTSRN